MQLNSGSKMSETFTGEKSNLLLICPQKYRQSLISAIRANNYIYRDYSYKTLPQNKILKRIIGKTRFLFEAYSYFSFNSKLHELLIRYKPAPNEYILVVHGHYVNPSNSRLLKEQNPGNIILWTTDSISRHRNQKGILPFSSKVFIHDGGVIITGREVWFPFGFDGEVFIPRNIHKDIDILFVGNIYSGKYRNRLKYLLMLERSELSKKFKCVYAGQVSGLFTRIKFILSVKNLRKIGKLGSGELSEFINRSKVCINIHQDDGLMTANPMFFAIPACGSIMITDKKQYLAEWLEPDLDYFTATKDNIIEKISALLAKDIYIMPFSKAGKHSLSDCLRRIVDA